MSKIFNVPIVSSLIICSILFLSSCEEDPSLPKVITSLSEFAKTTATFVGNVTDDGGAGITARGVCWSETGNPTTLNDKTSDGSGTGSFTSILTALTDGTTYYVRAYATNSVGTSYGNEITFTTNPATKATLSTNPISSILSVSAVSGGNISDDGGSEITARGICWSTSTLPDINDNKTTDGTGAESFTSHITGIEPDYRYYVRAYATNSAGTAYGNELDFLTKQIRPTIQTSEVTDITSYSATCGGFSIDPADTPISAKGIRYGTNQSGIYDSRSSFSIEEGSGDSDFTSTMTGLIMDTVYYVTAYATNASGTAYGEIKSFRTDSIPAPINFSQDVNYGSVTDFDGNSYKTITIGTQTWMAENLKTTHYNDGSEIPLVVEEAEWSFSGTHGYCWYKNDEANYKDVYGALYKMFAVSTDKLCPAGWHVPTDEEWTVLADYLGGSDVAGGKMKETGYTHWIGTNEGATNESGFTALPGGLRSSDGTFGLLGSSGYYWAIGPYTYNIGVRLVANKTRSSLTTFNFKDDGVSVRCVED